MIQAAIVYIIIERYIYPRHCKYCTPTVIFKAFTADWRMTSPQGHVSAVKEVDALSAARAVKEDPHRYSCWDRRYGSVGPRIQWRYSASAMHRRILLARGSLWKSGAEP